MQLREYSETTPKDEKNLGSFKGPKKRGWSGTGRRGRSKGKKERERKGEKQS